MNNPGGTGVFASTASRIVPLPEKKVLRSWSICSTSRYRLIG
jgi:hypothetical protein